MKISDVHRGRHRRRRTRPGSREAILAVVALLAGTFVLGRLPAAADVTAVDVRVSAGTDDAEERSSGGVSLTSGDLEMIFDGGDQTVGVRFASVPVPAGATVTAASIQFTADEVDGEATALRIEAQAADDAPTFTTGSGDISNRSRTAASVTWSPPPWGAIGAAGPEQRTDDLSTVLQEVVGRPGWTAGHAIVVVISGTGRRVADSFDGDPTTAPLLHVEYQAPAPAECTFWVSPTGDDAGAGRPDAPWATITHAAATVPDAGCTVEVAPGIYEGPVTVERRFATETVFRSTVPHRAVLEHTASVLDVDGAHNVTFSGFEIRHAGPGSTGYLVNVDKSNGDGVWAERVTLTDNVIHDSYDNDLVKIQSGVRNAVVAGNVFYNQGPNEQHLDLNSVTDVTVTDNVFFNDFARSGRVVQAATKHFIVVKDSGGSDDGLIGARRVHIRRNVFLHWEGAVEALVQIGNDGKPYHEAIGVDVENNLFLGDGTDPVSAPFGVAGAKDVSVVNNTVVGDLPASSYGMRVVRKGENPPNENVRFANNVWADSTGTMDGFSSGVLADTAGLTLASNLYWNGGAPIPGGDLLSPLVDDPSPVVADPGLAPDQTGIVLPYWTGTAFVSGATDVRSEFVRLVTGFGSTASTGPARGAADPTLSPVDDILGTLRDSDPDVGAFEVTGPSPPVAVDDQAETAAGVAVVVDVLANDVDPDGDLDPDSLTTGCGGCRAPESGTVSVGAGSTVLYTPAPGFSGSDGFTYQVCDLTSLCAIGAVTVVVSSPPANTAPVAADDGAVTAMGIAVVVDVLANDTDANGDSLTVAALSQPTGGAVAPSGMTAVVYTPAPGFSGVDTFTYRADDGRDLSSPATVTVTVVGTNTYAPVSESTPSGQVTSGSLADVTLVDGVMEAVTESRSGGKPARRVTALDHRWTFQIGGSSTSTLVLDAHRSGGTPADVFVLTYSVDGGATFQSFANPVVVVATTAGVQLRGALPDGTSGTVVIRATDADRTAGDGLQDTLFVDRLVIEAG